MLSVVTSDRRDRPLCLQMQTMAVGGQGPAPTLHLAVAAGTAPSLGPSRGWGGGMAGFHPPGIPPQRLGSLRPLDASNVAQNQGV